MRELGQAEAELARRQRQRPAPLSTAERNALLALGQDLGHVWSAPTTTARDKKELLRTLLEEVGIAVFRSLSSKMSHFQLCVCVSSCFF